MNSAVTHYPRAMLLAALLFGAGSLTACGGHTSAGAPDKTLNVYNWAGYIAPDTGANFERETGIEVHYSTYESNEISETKLLTGLNPTAGRCSSIQKTRLSSRIAAS